MGFFGSLRTAIRRPYAPAAAERGDVNTSSHANDAAKLLYPYGDGEGGYCVWVEDLADVARVAQAVRLPQCPKPLRVVCEDPGLRDQARLACPRTELIALEDVARLSIPIVVMPGPDHEASALARLDAFYRRTGRNPSPYDWYRVSDVVESRTSCPYRGVSLELYPTVLWPTLYSNWAFINYLRDQAIGDARPDVLDMYAGSGVIGLCLRDETNLNSIAFADVNFWAIKSIRETMRRNPRLSGQVFLSEGFSGIPVNMQFDLIVGNPPHADVALDHPKRLPGADPGWEAHDSFFKDAASRLRSGGRIVFIESASAGIEAYYERIGELYPGLRSSESVKLQNHICYMQQVTLA